MRVILLPWSKDTLVLLVRVILQHFHVEIDGTDEVQVVGYNEVVGVATDED